MYRIWGKTKHENLGWKRRFNENGIWGMGFYGGFWVEYLGERIY